MDEGNDGDDDDGGDGGDVANDDLIGPVNDAGSCDADRREPIVAGFVDIVVDAVAALALDVVVVVPVDDCDVDCDGYDDD